MEKQLKNEKDLSGIYYIYIGQEKELENSTYIPIPAKMESRAGLNFTSVRSLCKQS
jgi:hypothetical protein